MLLPFKLLGLGIAVCLGLVLMGLIDLTKGLGRVVLAITLVAVAPLLALGLVVNVCWRVARGATSEELVDEFRRSREETQRRRRLRELARVLDGLVEDGMSRRTIARAVGRAMDPALS